MQMILDRKDIAQCWLSELRYLIWCPPKPYCKISKSFDLTMFLVLEAENLEMSTLQVAKEIIQDKRVSSTCFTTINTGREKREDTTDTMENRNLEMSETPMQAPDSIDKENCLSLFFSISRLPYRSFGRWKPASTLQLNSESTYAARERIQYREWKNPLVKGIIEQNYFQNATQNFSSMCFPAKLPPIIRYMRRWTSRFIHALFSSSVLFCS